MTNYQIKIVDEDLTDFVHEITAQVTARVVSAGGPEVKAREVYPAVFAAAKEALRACVRGFHVCGCARHCDAESEGTELGTGESVGRLDAKRVHRYVLSIEVPLAAFARDVEFKILKAVADHAPIKNWHGRLFPIVRHVVEPLLGRHLYFSPACNRGEYLCEVGACTEFDPWAGVAPKEVA